MFKSINRLKYGDVLNLPNPKTEYKSFYDSKQADEWGRVIYTDWAAKYKHITQLAGCLSPKIDSISKSVIESYCGYSYKQINSYMRRHNSKDEQYKEAADILTFVIASAPQIPENIVVYRSVCDDFIQELIEKNRHGMPTLEPGFLSTSLLIDIYKEKESYSRNPNLLKIYVPKDTFGIYVNTITFRNEYEMLIAPNYYLRLVEYPYKDHATEKTIYECKLFSLSY